MKRTQWRDRNKVLAHAASVALEAVRALTQAKIPIIDIRLAGRQPSIQVEPCRAVHELGAQRTEVDRWEARFHGCLVFFGPDEPPPDKPRKKRAWSLGERALKNLIKLRKNTHERYS
jgi:hypothetical protein